MEHITKMIPLLHKQRAQCAKTTCMRKPYNMTTKCCRQTIWSLCTKEQPLSAVHKHLHQRSLSACFPFMSTLQTVTAQCSQQLYMLLTGKTYIGTEQCVWNMYGSPIPTIYKLMSSQVPIPRCWQQGSLCEERPVPAGSDGPTCRAQLSPSAKLGAVGRVGRHCSSFPSHSSQRPGKEMRRRRCFNFCLCFLLLKCILIGSKLN